MPPRYSESEAREAIAASRTFTEALRRLGMCVTGGAQPVLRKWAAIWEIPVDHFDPDAVRLETLARARNAARRPIGELLAKGVRVNRGTLKERLYAEGLKQPECELCGQGEIWRGRRMSLILDHVNGDNEDNRLENLRVVCPNCNATLDTHCGRNARTLPITRECDRCGSPFRVKYARQRFCSRECGRHSPGPTAPRPDARRAERPPYGQLLAEVKELGWCGTGRKYGVSDNAIRKWVRAYERDDEAA